MPYVRKCATYPDSVHGRPSTQRDRSPFEAARRLRITPPAPSSGGGADIATAGEFATLGGMGHREIRNPDLLSNAPQLYVPLLLIVAGFIFYQCLGGPPTRTTKPGAVEKYFNVAKPK